MLDNIITLIIAVFLQAVLSVDNLLYISFESKNAPENKVKYVRNLGIGIAIILRLILLFVFIKIFGYFKEPLFGISENKLFSGEFNLHSLIEFLGGAFIIYTAIKEIWHLISIEDFDKQSDKKQTSITRLIIMIGVMNLIFSFDSILSVIAFTNVVWVMVTAVLIGGILMIWLSAKITSFLQKNKKFEILGLFILFLVGVMLITEAAHNSHMKIFGNEIKAMNSSAFYFILFILVVVDILQTKYQKKLQKKEKK